MALKSCWRVNGRVHWLTRSWAGCWKGWCPRLGKGKGQRLWLVAVAVAVVAVVVAVPAAAAGAQAVVFLQRVHLLLRAPAQPSPLPSACAVPCAPEECSSDALRFSLPPRLFIF